MAHSLSARKRVRQNEKHRLFNRALKSRLKTQMKKFDQALESGDAETIKAALTETFSVIDMTAKKGVIHKNTAARRKAQAHNRAKAAGATV